MYSTSEYVSLGHPDKVADYISCYILDRYLERDPNTRFALEVQIKDEFVTLGGEITSKADFTAAEITKFARNAVNAVGYTQDYQKRWGIKNTICGDELDVAMHIGRQSPDISQGVDSEGWGDQGIFWGMATNTPETDYMPYDHYLAKKIGKHLFDIKYAGLDIKTQVTMLDGKPNEIVVAIPMQIKHSNQDIANAVQWCCGGSKDYKLTVNGTGKFTTHGPTGDCGTTGRKLAVDFYGGNCVIGGGSPWTKDGTKADLSLNMLARKLAVEYVKCHPELGEVYCAISCCIGSPEVLIVITDKFRNELSSTKTVVKPSEVISEFRLREPRFADMCRNGLFYGIC